MIDATFLAHFLSDPSDARAIVLGLITAWALSDASHRRALMVISGILGASVVILLSMDDIEERLGLAIMVGVAAPFLYQILMRIVNKFLPWLGTKS